MLSAQERLFEVQPAGPAHNNEQPRPLMRICLSFMLGLARNGQTSGKRGVARVLMAKFGARRAQEKITDSRLVSQAPLLLVLLLLWLVVVMERANAVGYFAFVL